ncbi:SDR family NAD(P)-dependent oxidoreductase [Agrilactobacillus yilanensis]|uniref:SDR family NAD(P)-dependent oxidoreductase n=1 Tax=Agrilactobacillus yilanensis TaxID=2485997 RepID=A0ABW4J5L3_9LACO|nr:SDR family NAD(P)-dependent oxidoreductase [Agrilactobacillus yilanensis]
MKPVAVITGGTRGIGRALVATYLKQGFQVATFSRNAQHTAALRQAFPEAALYIATFDVNDADLSRQFIRKVMQKFGIINVYIFNSGICQDQTFVKMTTEQWQQVMATNLLAAFAITQEVFQQVMLQTQPAKIFLMTSSAGIEGAYGQANYAASKGALIGLMKTLALEGKKYEITVNAIAPAALTEMTAPVIHKLQVKYQHQGRDLPAYWRIGSAQEVATSLYRLTCRKELGTGQIFALNGTEVMIYQPAEKRPFVW